jgi:hypothetical protein
MSSRKSIAERIAQLEARKKSLQARLSKQERATDTRRKVLLGALLLHRIESDPEAGPRMREWVRRELPEFLTRDADKVLFADLLPSSDTTEPAAQP